MKLNPKTKDRLAVAGTVLLLSAGAFSTPGCAIVPLTVPHECSAVLDHTSHPLQGWPFGPNNEEDTLNALGASCRWSSADGRLRFDAGPQWMYTDGGFYGDHFIFNARVSVKVWTIKEKFE